MYNFDHIIDNIPLGYIKESNIHGYGLFAKSSIYKNEIIVKLDGQIIGWNKYNDILNMIGSERNRYTDPLFLEWNCLGNKNREKDTPENTKLLVRPLRTKYSFINHSRNPNLLLIEDNKQLKLITLRDIDKDEELTFDYRTEPLPDIYYEEHGKYYL